MKARLVNFLKILLRISVIIIFLLAFKFISAKTQSLGHLNVFIFAGQSNMAGTDALIGGTGKQNLADAGLQTQTDRNTFFTYGTGSTLIYNTILRPWGDIRGHLGTSSVFPGNYYVHGPEVGFERVLAANGVDNIAIIKVANNYSALENGRSAWVKGNSIYTSLTSFVNQRLQDLTNLGYTYTIRGFIWHQGIDDAILGRSQTDYRNDLIQIISDLRNDYGTVSTPFVLARSVNNPIVGAVKMAPIRAAQVNVASSVAYTGWINIDDLTPYINSVHLSAQSQITAGERFATAWLSLTKKENKIKKIL